MISWSLYMRMKKTLQICLATMALFDRVGDLERQVMATCSLIAEQDERKLIDIVNDLDQEEREVVGDKATARKGYTLFLNTIAMEAITDKRDGITDEVNNEIQDR